MAATLSVSPGCASPHLLLRKQSLCITKQSQSSLLEEKCAYFCVDSTANLSSVRLKCTFVAFTRLYEPLARGRMRIRGIIVIRQAN